MEEFQIFIVHKFGLVLFLACGLFMSSLQRSLDVSDYSV
jgi:hypothetical protein